LNGGILILTLLIRPEPHFDESIVGFLIRCAEENGASLRWLIKGIGIRSKVVFYNELELNQYIRLSDLTTINLKTLLQMDYVRSISKFVKSSDCADNMVSRYFVSLFMYTKVCSLCLHEHGYQKKEWSIIAVTACPEHNGFLVDRCTNCGKLIEAF
jgi:hypothetical protein